MEIAQFHETKGIYLIDLHDTVCLHTRETENRELLRP